ncbi:MAG: hypothetical protein JNL19_08080 [Burkholderiales bacterium]|nr:hypothetical protein [Burkholderiales bacterium]
MLCSPLAGAQTGSAAVALHGADAVFATDDVGVVWAVQKQSTSDKATVWLRVVNRTGKFTHVAIDGVDPFSKKRERVTPVTVFSADLRVGVDRETFVDLTSREIHLFRSAADATANQPAVTVFYLGVPDTVPEFTDALKLEAYLRDAKLVSHSLKTLVR